jgi:hypothetical protein
MAEGRETPAIAIADSMLPFIQPSRKRADYCFNFIRFPSRESGQKKESQF